MSRVLIILLSLLIVSCASQKSDFEGTNDFSKPIADGLYYLREGAAGRYFESSKEVKTNWKIKAKEICRGEFEALIYQDSEHNYMITDPETFFLPVWAQGPSPVADGVIHCTSSTLTKEQATQVLIDEFYILTK